MADEEGTIFPFWLFCIAWAVASYMVVRVIVSEPATAVNAMVVNATAATASAAMQPLREEYGEGEPVMKPGYYRLNAAQSKKGVPKYVYIGPEEPEA